MPKRYYSPALTRLVVKALYHEGKRRNLPMTRLINLLLEEALRDTNGWRRAERALAVCEPSKPYRSTKRSANNGPS